MRKIRNLFAYIIVSASPVAISQTLTVIPNTATVVSGAELQFSAKVTGTTSPVTWLACYGATVSSSGLYTAPVVTAEEGSCAAAIITGVWPPLVSAAFVQVTPPLPCGPPSYSCDSTETDVVQTPNPPFSASSPVNTVVREAILSKAFISRVTGPTTGGPSGVCGTNNQWNATPSGGSNDVITNTNTTLLTITCNGGYKYVLGFNPSTLQVYPGPGEPLLSATMCNGNTGFSRLNPLVWFCKPVAEATTPLGIANGTTIYQVTFVNAPLTNLCGLGVGRCPDPSTAPTWAPFFDFATCPQASAAPPISYSILGIGPNDSAFSENISWTGYQDTARYYFYYVPGTGCSTLDTLGNGISPIQYSPSGVATIISSVTATWNIHESYTNGAWASTTATNCKGSSCGTGDGAPTWQANTSNLVMFSAMPRDSGHSSYSPSYFFNNGNPQFWRHPLLAPSTYTQIGNTPCKPKCQDAHFSGDVNSDVNPLLGTTTGPAEANAIAPYRNEVFGVSTDGSGTMWRFSKTYSSGTAVTSFSPQGAIGAPSQDRTVFFFTSDMLCNLGITSTDLCRWDIFGVGLIGQGQLTTP